jgi:hypothetical protein
MMFRHRSVLEIMVLCFLGIVCFMLVMATVLVMVIELHDPHADTTNIVQGLMSILSGILGALLGLLAGRGEGRGSLNRRPDEPTKDD